MTGTIASLLVASASAQNYMPHFSDQSRSDLPSILESGQLYTITLEAKDKDTDALGQFGDNLWSVTDSISVPPPPNMQDCTSIYQYIVMVAQHDEGYKKFEIKLYAISIPPNMVEDGVSRLQIYDQPGIGHWSDDPYSILQEFLTIRNTLGDPGDPGGDG